MREPRWLNRHDGRPGPLRRLLAAGFAVTLMGHVAPARANLVIAPTFDSTITSDPNAASIEAVINNAVLIYESTFTNNITVNFTFGEMSSGLGQSNTAYYTETYSAYRTQLAAGATSTDRANALQYDIPNTPNNPVTNSPNISVTSALAHALNLEPANGGIDSTITLNTHITDVGSPDTSGQYSLRVTVQHEIDEALGLGSALAPSQTSTPTDPNPEDLLRFSGPGVRSFTTTLPQTQPYESFDGGTTSLVQYNNNTPPNTGGDYGDYNGVGGPYVQDAFANPGENPVLGIELRTLNVIGYDMTGTPEPGALTMLGSIALGASAYGLWHRKRRAKTGPVVEPSGVTNDPGSAGAVDGECAPAV